MKALWTQIILITAVWSFAFWSLKMSDKIFKYLFGLFNFLQVRARSIILETKFSVLSYFTYASTYSVFVDTSCVSANILCFPLICNFSKILFYCNKKVKLQKNNVNTL